MTECTKCKRRFKTISKEGLCYYCYLKVYGVIPEEFRPRGKYAI